MNDLDNVKDDYGHYIAASSQICFGMNQDVHNHYHQHIKEV